MPPSNSRLRTAIALVVENDPLQRMNMPDLVEEEEGFEAVLARDADHAMAVLTDRLDITVVFTDIDMPGSMNGLKLAAAIRERWPPIEIIVTTAGLAPDLRSLPACAIFLPKPLVPDDAIRTLQSLAAWKTVKRSPASPGRSERQAHAASHSAMRDRDGWP